MTQGSGPAWRTPTSGPRDAHGLAVLLLAAGLAAGTALPQVGSNGSAFPASSVTEVSDRARTEAGRRAEGRGSGPTTARSKPLPVAWLDLNTADAEALQALPGIGPALAGRIVADREAQGPFRTAEDLLRVPGIGPKRWERIRHAIRVVAEGP